MSRPVVLSIVAAATLLAASPAHAQPAPGPQPAPIAQPAPSPQPAPIAQPDAAPPPALPEAAPAPIEPPREPPRAPDDEAARVHEPASRAPIRLASAHEDPYAGRYAEVAPRPPTRYAQRGIGLEAGVRMAVITDGGYDPYAESDVLPSLALTASFVPLHRSGLSLAVMAEYDVGGSTATARTLESSLTMHRASLGLAARLDLGSRLYGFVKAAPGAVYVHGSIVDVALDRPLVADAWTWNVDALGGLGLLLGSAGDPEAPAVRVWVVGELGYAFAGEADMAFAPADDEDDPRRFGSVSLPGFRPRGVVNRFAVALTF